jgi:hypothetical protein
MGLMAEVNASFQKLTHTEVRQRHVVLRLIRRGPMGSILATTERKGPPDGHLAKVRV